MNNELPKSPKHDQPLDARFAARPEVRERLHQIADMMDQAIAEGATADEAEAMAIGERGRYTIDFYHVSEYLAGAAAKMARPGKQTEWRRRQQARLLENKTSAVLRALEKGLEPAGALETPVRAAYEYIQERRDHMDYAGARSKGLSIGSGEIQSGHRHVIQQRLKISGAWWTEKNMESMLQLRTARANDWWDIYWLMLEIDRHF